MTRIDRILARRINLPLREPFETAQRRAVSSPTVLVELAAGDVVGYGEATPVRYVTGEDVVTVVHDIATAARALEGARLSEYRLSSRKLAEVLPHGKSARAGIEIAIFDAYCKTLGIPLHAFLGGAPLRIETDVTVPIVPPEHARERAVELSAKGFKQFKVKVGKDEDEDLARVVAISEGAPSSSFIIDANQGFTPGLAVEFARELLERGLKILAFEQPVDAADLDGMRQVTAEAGVPVFADEAVQSPSDVIKLLRYEAAHGVNVKIQKSGMVGALDIISICQGAGLGLMFGCMLESKIGQSAAVHIGCGTNAFGIFDLDSDLLVGDQPVKGGAERHGAMLKVSDRPGLGCEIIESELQAFGEVD